MYVCVCVCVFFYSYSKIQRCTYSETCILPVGCSAFLLWGRVEHVPRRSAPATCLCHGVRSMLLLVLLPGGGGERKRGTNEQKRRSSNFQTRFSHIQTTHKPNFTPALGVTDPEKLRTRSKMLTCLSKLWCGFGTLQHIGRSSTKHVDKTTVVRCTSISAFCLLSPPPGLFRVHLAVPAHTYIFVCYYLFSSLSSVVLLILILLLYLSWRFQCLSLFVVFSRHASR